jgi:hypothetical protein
MGWIHRQMLTRAPHGGACTTRLIIVTGSQRSTRETTARVVVVVVVVVVVGILIVGYKPDIHEGKGILSHERGKVKTQRCYYARGGECCAWTWSLKATGMKGKGGSVVCVRGRRGIREGSEEWRGAGWSAHHHPPTPGLNQPRG